MTPIETAALFASALAILVFVPIAFFHARIASELRHLRAHFFGRPKSARRVAPRAAAPKGHASRKA